MLNKFITIIGSISLALVSTTALFNFTVLAADPSSIDAHNKDGDLSVIKCIEKGNIDFGVFWDSVIYSDSFTDGLIEPWYDVLSRNQCHSNDVYSLIKQQDKIRKTIRNAFLSCNNQKVPQLKKAFQKITAEIYYVRNIVNSGLIVSLPYDIVSTSLFKEAAITDRSKIYNDMYEKYVKEDFFSPEDFENYFLQIESKYESRRNTYIECEKGSWQTVGEKWNEFVKFFAEDAAGLKEAAKTIGAKAGGKGPSLLNELKTMKTVELFTTDESFTDYLGSFVQLNINNLAPKDSLEEVAEFMNRDSSESGGDGGGSGSSGGVVSQGELAASKVASDRLFDLEKTKTEIQSHFDGLYKKSSDENLELFVNNLDGRLTGGEDDGLLEIINGSFMPLSEMLSMSKRMVDRQCPGSE